MKRSLILIWIVLVGASLLTSRLAQADRVDDLIRQLGNEGDYKVRLSAALNLGKLGDKRAIPALVKALRDTDKTVRGVSAAALGKLVDGSVASSERSRILAELERVAKSDPDGFVKSQARKAYDALKGLKDGAGKKEIFVDVGPMADSTKDGGDGMKTFMRKTIQGTLGKKAPAFATELGRKSPTQKDLKKAGIKAAFYVDGTLTSLSISRAGSSADVECNVSLVLASYPEKSMFGFIKGGARVSTGSSPASIEEAKQDCVGAVLEDLVTRKIVPTIEQRVP